MNQKKNKQGDRNIVKKDFVSENPMITQALGELMDRRVEAIPIVGHTFSPAFERRMNRLTRQVSKPYYHLVNTNAKKAVLALAATIILFITMVFSVSALREPVVRFIVEIYEKFSAVFLVRDDDQAPPTTLEVIYEPTWLPDGYELSEEASIATDIFRISQFIHDEDVLEFRQSILSAGMNLDTEGIATQSMIVNGVSAIFYINKGVSNLVWENSQYIFSLSGTVKNGDLLRIAESIREK